MHFQPDAALSAAENILAINRQSDAAHFVAFMAHAELFGRTAAQTHRDLAMLHYRNSTELNPDRRLFPADFHALTLIGTGGFAYVFHVTRGLTHMALKVLKQRLVLPESTYREFSDAVLKLAKCHSPYVAGIHEVCPLGAPTTYYALEYLDGQSLRSWIIAGTSILASRATRQAHTLNVIDIALQVSKGLQATHEHNLWHLDLKPENILLCRFPEGTRRAVLVDFNFLTLQRSGLAYTSLMPLQTTLLYCAPEVKENIVNASAQSDVYSLGLVLLEMIGGRVDFRTTFDTLIQLSEEEPHLAVLVLASIDVDPAKRPRDCAEVTATLTEIQQDLQKREADSQKLRDSLQRIPIKLPLGGLGDALTAVWDLIRGRRLRQAELALSLASLTFLFATIFQRLYSRNFALELLPSSLAALSFTLLECLYFVHIVFRGEYMNSRFPDFMRFVMSWGHVPFVLLGVLIPRLWPLGAAGGMMLTGTNNVAMWVYARRFRLHDSSILTSERKETARILQGYYTWAYIYGAALVAGWSALDLFADPWKADLIFAGGVLTTNALLYLTKIRGESSRRIWAGLRVEYAVRLNTATSWERSRNGQQRRAPKPT